MAGAGPRRTEMTLAVLRGYPVEESERVHTVRPLGSAFHGFFGSVFGGRFSGFSILRGDFAFCGLDCIHGFGGAFFSGLFRDGFFSSFNFTCAIFNGGFETLRLGRLVKSLLAGSRFDAGYARLAGHVVINRENRDQANRQNGCGINDRFGKVAH